jgi:hypothetical protein
MKECHPAKRSPSLVVKVQALTFRVARFLIGVQSADFLCMCVCEGKYSKPHSPRINASPALVAVVAKNCELTSAHTVRGNIV